MLDTGRYIPTFSFWDFHIQRHEDWVIATSENGWTTNERGLEWIQHFNKHTNARTSSSYPLLALDGHESHHSVEFELYCKDDTKNLLIYILAFWRLLPLNSELKVLVAWRTVIWIKIFSIPNTISAFPDSVAFSFTLDVSLWFDSTAGFPYARTFASTLTMSH